MKQQRYFCSRFWAAEASDEPNDNTAVTPHIHIRLIRGHESLSFPFNFSLTPGLRLFALHMQAPHPDRQQMHHLQQATATAATFRRKGSQTNRQHTNWHDKTDGISVRRTNAQIYMTRPTEILADDIDGEIARRTYTTTQTGTTRPTKKKTEIKKTDKDKTTDRQAIQTNRHMDYY